MTTPMTLWHRLHSSIRSRLADAGLDLVAALNADWYRQADREPIAPLEPLPDDAYVLITGNTRALWPVFLRALRRNPTRLHTSDPLDSWIEQKVRDAVRPVGIDYRILWAHEPLSDESYPPLQQLAESAGLAAISPTHLSVHPVYGPWVALRAAVAFDLPGPSGTPPEPPASCQPCPPECRRCLDRAMQTAEGRDATSVEEAWRDWVAVRDACSVGAEYRYSDDQIRYHYRKDRTHLAEAAGVDVEFD